MPSIEVMLYATSKPRFGKRLITGSVLYNITFWSLGEHYRHTATGEVCSLRFFTPQGLPTLGIDLGILLLLSKALRQSNTDLYIDTYVHIYNYSRQSLF